MEPNYQPNFTNGYGSQHHQLTSLSSLSNASQYPHTTPGTPNTLPPLHSQNGILPPFHPSAFGPHAVSAPQTPRAVHTPGGLSSMGGNASNFTHLPQLPTRPPQHAQPNYILPPYSNAQTMVSPNILSQPNSSLAQIGPHGARLPDLRPMPHGGMGSQSHMPVQSGYPPIMSSQQFAPGPESPPTHVVGSQGRRGVLPSEPGRPSVTSGNGAKTTVPAKDADGKFPCLHCNKTYLHAKHLKRHMLRHTGDRPYQCVLCKDTFSRSDILKRHFQKCSLRRGNPQNVGHLSHTGAHLKRAQSGTSLASTPGADGQEMIPSNGHGIPQSVPVSTSYPAVTGPPLDQPFHGSSVPPLSNGSYRSNGAFRPNGSAGQDMRSIPALPSLMSTGASYPNSLAVAPLHHDGNSSSLSMHQMPPLNQVAQYSNFTPVHGNSLPQLKAETTHSNYAQGSSIDRDPARQNGNAQGPGEWSQVFQPSNQTGFMHTSAVEQGQAPVKSEPGMVSSAYQPAGEVMYNGLYSGEAQPNVYQNWNDMVVRYGS